MNKKKRVKVSIIIPAYNEEQRIAACLSNIANQSFKESEVIMIDDFSQDRTALVCKREGEKLRLNLKIITPKFHQERGVIRNLGAKIAKGDFLLFLDADMRLSRDVIKECVSLLGNKKVRGAIIPEESVGDGFWSKCKILEKRCYWGDDEIEAARFFNKKSFWDIGGWDESMISGEDWDLTSRFRKKYKIDRVKSLIFHEEGKLTLIGSAKKKFYYAVNANSYLKKYPTNFSHLFFFVFRPAYTRNWKILLADPIHAAGMFFLKAIEITAGVLGLVYSKIQHLF